MAVASPPELTSERQPLAVCWSLAGRRLEMTSRRLGAAESGGEPVIGMPASFLIYTAGGGGQAPRSLARYGFQHCAAGPAVGAAALEAVWHNPL